MQNYIKKQENDFGKGTTNSITVSLWTVEQ